MHKSRAIWPIILVISQLTGCHEPYRLTVVNSTDRAVFSRINYFDPAQPTAHGDLGPGVILNLTEASSEIRSIEYLLEGRWCEIDGREIASVTEPGPGGRPTVNLIPCDEGDS